jgi:hypothetical protein
MRFEGSFWPYAADEALAIENILLDRFKGAAGTGPTGPVDHSEKRILFWRLDAEGSIGVRLTESDVGGRAPQSQVPTPGILKVFILGLATLVMIRCKIIRAGNVLLKPKS